MKLIEYISYLMIPLMIVLIIAYASSQKKEVYQTFIDGVKDGTKILLKLFPTMIGIFVAINLFQVSGAMDGFIKLVSPLTSMIKIPNEVVPLGIMRSISGI